MLSQKTVYIEEDWWDDNMIIKHMMKRGYKIQLSTHNYLLNMDSEKFLKNIYFCNTMIVQHHINNLGRNDIIPDTYEDKYKEYFNREIEKMTFGELLDKYKNIPKFIKPVNNDKMFDGRIFIDTNDFTDFCLDIPPNDMMIYVTDPITILFEARLLIGGNKLYGGVNSYAINPSPPLQAMPAKHGSSMMNTSPSLRKNIPNYLESEFVKNLINITSNFRCIDIGINDMNELFVIEINPPFSLDNYNIDMKSYIDFCIDACQNISQKIFYEKK